MTLVGVDYGTVRIGLAKSDEDERIAFPLTTVARGKSDEEGVRAVREALSDVEARGLVVGLPLKLDGSEGEATRRARRFASLLGEAMGLEVSFVDERLTSVEVERSLREMGVSARDHRGTVDERAASIILKTHLDGMRESTWEAEPSEIEPPSEPSKRPGGHRGRRVRSRR